MKHYYTKKLNEHLHLLKQYLNINKLQHKTLKYVLSILSFLFKILEHATYF